MRAIRRRINLRGRAGRWILGRAELDRILAAGEALAAAAAHDERRALLSPDARRLIDTLECSAELALAARAGSAAPPTER